MDLSVIVCCYRGEETIEECLESLCTQSYNNQWYEVIIVDDDSIDDSTARINSFLKNKPNKFPLIKYFKKENKGLSVARNFGVEKASGSLVSFIDEDAKADKNFVSSVVETFNSNLKINCLGGKVELWNQYDYFAKIYHYGYFNAMMNDSAIIGTNMSFRKSFINDIGGFIAEFDKRGDETALFLKAGNKLSKMVSEDVIVHHSQPNSERSFFSVRNQNGAVGYECQQLSLAYGHSIVGVYIRSLYHLTFITLPIIIIISIFISISLVFILSGTYTLLFIARFFILGHLLKPLRSLYRASMKKSIKDYLYLSWLVIYGSFQEDLGYIKMQIFSK